MIKNISKLLLVCVVISLFYAATPGSAQDPLITESYLLSLLEQEREARTELSSRITALEQQLQQISLTPPVTTVLGDEIKENPIPSQIPEQTNESVQSLAPQVVSLSAGEAFYATAGTEIILRSGEAIAIASSLGGLADLTKGADLRQGEFLVANHLLLVPRDDGRGVEALTDAVFLVMGEIRYRLYNDLIIE